MVSRDPNLLHPELKKRWFWLKETFERMYPDAPEPRLSCTYRPPHLQEQLVKEGKSKAGPGQSLHNYKPALAFDVFFNDDKGTPEDKSDDTADWDFINFRRFGELAESIGLEWGGRWPDLVDGPHIQFPMTFHDAIAEEIPELPPLPSYPKQRSESDDGWLLVVQVDGVDHTFSIPEGYDVVERVSIGRKRRYVTIRKG